MGEESSVANLLPRDPVSLRSSIFAVVEELKRSQMEGEESVWIDPLSIDGLEAVVKGVDRASSVAVDGSEKKSNDDRIGPSSLGEPEVHSIRIEPAYQPQRMGKPSRKGAGEEVPAPELGPPPVVQLPDGSPREQWDWLRERVLGCEVCRRNLNPGKKVVFGVGSLEADLFFCGEAPGAEEEARGEPFVGPAGELLNKMIGAMGLSRGEVYIANILNWRPKTGKSFGNRPPAPSEMAFCLPYLMAQIEVVRPKVVVALGATAAAGLLGIETKGRMGRLRGTWHSLKQGVPVTITYHPSFLLHNGSLSRRRQVWEDLLGAMEKVGLPISKQQRGYFLPKGGST